jgi:NhaP-type Na+/H+ or K+/H+ antiporter
MKKLKILLPYLLIFLGYAIFNIFNQINTQDIIHTSLFQILVDIILAVGLYGAVFGIDINEFKKNFKFIFNIVTIGVIFKVLFVGSIMYIFTNNPLSFLLATVIAQIDPVSVASLDNAKSKLSEKGKTILRAWAAFDDPITVVLAISISMIILSIQNSPLDILYNELRNILFASIIYIIYIIKTEKNNFFLNLLLLISFIVSIYFELFLAIAIIGLFLRPKLFFLDKIIYILFLIVSFIIGILINNGVNILDGIILGILTIIAQTVTTFILGKTLIQYDKYRLSLAQQSGITAITLSLFLSIKHDNIISTIIVAIITINILYIILNLILEKFIMKNKPVGT